MFTDQSYGVFLFFLFFYFLSRIRKQGVAKNTRLLRYAVLIKKKKEELAKNNNSNNNIKTSAKM